MSTALWVMRCKLTEKTMNQPAAGGAAFRVRLIAFVPICMALAVHISSNRCVILSEVTCMATVYKKR